jgi:hypothetical protein
VLRQQLELHDLVQAQRGGGVRRAHLAALPLPTPLVGVLPDAPRVAVKPKGTEGETRGGTVEPAAAGNPCYATAASVRTATDEIPIPRGHPSPPSWRFA